MSERYAIVPPDPDEPVALVATHVVENRSLSITARVTYAVLSTYRNKPTPSDGTLASQVPCSPGDLERAIEDLVDHGIVMRREPPNDGCRFMLLDAPPDEDAR